VNLGLIPTVAPYLLPHIARPIREKFPDLELLWRESQTDILVEELKKGRLDLIILAIPVEDSEGLIEMNLFEEQFLLAVPEDHPLAGSKGIGPEQLKGEKVLLLEEGHCLRGQALEVCMLAGAHEAADFRATSLETLRHLTAAGNGITLIPELAASAVIPGVKTIAFNEPYPLRTIGMMYRKSSGNALCFNKLGELIREITRGERMACRTIESDGKEAC
jgi:LysR family hydrogen peroxide-inducible transcriptional activator